MSLDHLKNEAGNAAFQKRDYRRIAAGDIEPGMRVARTRTAKFQEVVSVEPHAVSVFLHFANDPERVSQYNPTGEVAKARPNLTAKWWREIAVD